MKLAEALAERADASRRVEQLRSRIVSNARYQEGEEPAEDSNVLLVEASEVLDRLELLIQQINRTNASAPFAAGMTLTDALARRDVLRLRHSVLSGAADAAGRMAGASAHHATVDSATRPEEMTKAGRHPSRLASSGTR